MFFLSGIPALFTVMMDGSVLIFLNGPNDQLEFSMDGIFGKISSKFEGFHSIPLGIHFISYRINSNPENTSSPFITLIFHPSQPKVFLFEWCKVSELFKLSSINGLNPNNLLKYPGIVPYERFMNQELEGLSTWKRLTRFITIESVSKVFSESKISPHLFQVTPMMESHHDLLKELDSKTSSPVLNFSRIPSLKEFIKLTSTSNITQFGMDKSPIFHHFNYNFKDLFSELQISFLLLIFAQNFEGFLQWFDILNLLLKSFQLAQENPKQFCLLFRLLEDHFSFCPDDFFTVGLVNENKIYKLMAEFFKYFDGLGYEKEMKFYGDKFGWIFEFGEEVDQQDEPTIVE